MHVESARVCLIKEVDCTVLYAFPHLGLDRYLIASDCQLFEISEEELLVAMICNRISYVPHLLLHLLSHHHCLPGTQGKVELQYHCILFYSVSLPLQQGPDRREPVCIELAAPVVHESCHHTVGRLVEHIPRAISQVQLHCYLPSALSCPNVLVEDLDLSTGVLLDSEEGVLHGDYALCLRGDLESVLAPLEQVVEGHKEDVRNSPWRIELCNGSKLV